MTDAKLLRNFYRGQISDMPYWVIEYRSRKDDNDDLKTFLDDFLKKDSRRKNTPELKRFDKADAAMIDFDLDKSTLASFMDDWEKTSETVRNYTAIKSLVDVVKSIAAKMEKLGQSTVVSQVLLYPEVSKHAARPR